MSKYNSDFNPFRRLCGGTLQGFYKAEKAPSRELFSFALASEALAGHDAEEERHIVLRIDYHIRKGPVEEDLLHVFDNHRGLLVHLHHRRRARAGAEAVGLDEGLVQHAVYEDVALRRFAHAAEVGKRAVEGVGHAESLERVRELKAALARELRRRRLDRRVLRALKRGGQLFARERAEQRV